MTDLDLVSADLPLERQNANLRRIVAALMHRVERDTDESGNAFTLFQRAIALEAEVAARTADLQRTLDELNAANARLEAASLAAEEASRAKSRFLAAASHDLLQPLNAAKLFLGSLGEAELDPHARQVLDRLTSAFRSVEDILGALLDISRLDSDGARANPMPFGISRIFEPIANEFREVAAAGGTRLVVMPSTARIVSDPFHLRQIVQNLVANAVRYARGGRVLVGVRRIGEDRLRVEVHDTGPGIAPEDIPLIFGEFKRLDPPAGAEPGQGVGLGLAIVERACKLLDHPLELHSAPGRGTTFSVSLPRAPAPAEQPATESDATTIALVVARDTGLADRVAQLLEGWGMAALTADCAQSAAEQVVLLGILPDVLIVEDGLGEAAVAALAPAAPGGALPESLRVVRVADSHERPLGTLPAHTRTLLRPVRPHQLRAALA